MSKAGLDHLMKIFAEVLREQGIQVNGLDPGAIDMDTFMQDAQNVRLKTPERLARLSVFLISEIGM